MEWRGDMKKSLKYLFIICIVAGLFVSCASPSTEPDTSFREKVAYFSSDKDENIRYVRTKNYDGILVYEFTDSRNVYELNETAQIISIYLKERPTVVNLPMIAPEQLMEKSRYYIGRLAFDANLYEVTHTFNETTGRYTTISRQKSGEYFTGNNIYMQYLKEGILVSVSLKYENPEILNRESKVTMDQATGILMSYLKGNPKTQPYLDQLDPEKISKEVDVYNGKKVYNFYFTLVTDKTSNYRYKYAISTDTGAFLVKREGK
jgi:hypothetical protein